ncbi:response regulator [Carboxylicivirga linearis]|uniref:histidine kinase n=1 Tax=Carboxylicivirga linearis TaxID=1628157 RepID=A0ABS5K0I6_9BACT|nr:response regulator [Carboxylicivirga linearis]MBS2100656.1 response regulator [Carboxylicivirga linearis]
MSIKENKIIIIENYSNNLQLFELIFKGKDYSVFYAQNIKEAQKYLYQYKIKLIVSDYINIGGDLIEFFEDLKGKNPNIQKIILTDHIDHTYISKAINRGGIFSYIYKPIDPENLLIVIQKAIAQFDLQMENQTLIESLKLKNTELKKLFINLKSEEVKFRSIFNSSSDPSFITDFMGEILELNPAAKKLKDSFIQNPKDNNILKLFKQKDRFNFSKNLLMVDNGIGFTMEIGIFNKKLEMDRSFELRSYPINNKSKNAAMISLRDISARKEARKKEMQTIILTEEKERRRFAQELHDGIGPLLSTTKLYLEWFDKPNANINKSIIINKMKETIEETFDSIQEISNNISPNTLNSFGLDTAIQKFIQRLKNVSEIEFKYSNSFKSRLNTQLEITIYRIFCELINNSLKYANAKLISMKIESNHGVKLIYYDNGIGFKLTEINKKGNGFGISNIKARVLSLGGLFEMTSEPGKGTHVKINLLNE